MRGKLRANRLEIVYMLGKGSYATVHRVPYRAPSLQVFFRFVPFRTLRAVHAGIGCREVLSS